MNSLNDIGAEEMRIMSNELAAEQLSKLSRNPFSYMIANFDPGYFFGRNHYFDLILRSASSVSPSSFGIHGVKALGKTSLLRFLCDSDGATKRNALSLQQYRPNNKQNELKLIYSDFFSISGVSIISNIYKMIREAKIFPDLDSSLPEKDALLETIKLCNMKAIRLVLCLDNLDTALSSITHEDELFLRSLTPLASFVIATEVPLNELKQGRLISSAFLQVVMPCQLDLLAEDEVRSLIRVPLKKVNSEFEFSPADEQFLLDAAGRHPYFLTLACEFLLNTYMRFSKLSLGINEEVKNNLLIQMERLPLMTEMFSILWGLLNDKEKTTLYSIACELKKIDAEKEYDALSSLSEKCLIVQNLETGKYSVFSLLFRNYIRRQLRENIKDDLEDISKSLAPLDRKLLTYLLARPNQVCTFDELFTALWGEPKPKGGLETAIHRIRSKVEEALGADWDYIKNIRSKGYMYVPKPR